METELVIIMVICGLFALAAMLYSGSNTRSNQNKYKVAGVWAMSAMVSFVGMFVVVINFA